jgi:hypothetical protein
MKISTAISIATMVAAAAAAGTAGAQGAKVATAPVFFDNAYEAALPAEGTVTLPLTGLKTARVAMVTFVKFVNGAPVKDAQVMTVMEGVTVNWAGTKESCVYEVRLVPSPAAVTMTKGSGMCALKPPGNAVLRILAM